MVSKESLLKIKEDVEGYIGQEVLVRANIGRNKNVSKKCVIESTYPNIFVVQEQGTQNKMTYSYTDIVTNVLEMSLPSGEVISNYDFSVPRYTRL